MGEPERSRPGVVDGVSLSAIAAAFTDAAWQTCVPMSDAAGGGVAVATGVHEWRRRAGRRALALEVEAEVEAEAEAEAEVEVEVVDVEVEVVEVEEVMVEGARAWRERVRAPPRPARARVRGASRVTSTSASRATTRMRATALWRWCVGPRASRIFARAASARGRTRSCWKL
jgi:hypothetical protein